jgi:hypothetical protein
MVYKRSPTLTTILGGYNRFQPFIRIYKKIPNFPMTGVRADFLFFTLLTFNHGHVEYTFVHIAGNSLTELSLCPRVYVV